MDENRLIILGFIWFVVNRLYVNSCIQEDNELQKGLAKISHSPDAYIPIPSMPRNTRSMIGLGIASIGLLIGFLLMHRIQARQTLAANNEVIPARPPENPIDRISIASGSSSSSSFFQANNSSADPVTPDIPEQINTQEPKTNSPK